MERAILKEMNRIKQQNRYKARRRIRRANAATNIGRKPVNSGGR